MTPIGKGLDRRGGVLQMTAVKGGGEAGVKRSVTKYYRYIGFGHNTQHTIDIILKIAPRLVRNHSWLILNIFLCVYLEYIAYQLLWA